jgi:arabinan endo-1,5-alpha-L-arabinosidase
MQNMTSRRVSMRDRLIRAAALAVLTLQGTACTGSAQGPGPVGTGAGGAPGGAGQGGGASSGAGGASIITGAGGGSSTGVGGGSVTGVGGTTGAPVDAGTGARDAAGGGPDLAPPTGPGPGTLGGGPVTVTTTHLDIGVHDPSMIWDGSKYYLFATGGSISYRGSTNLTQWSNAGRVYTAIPSWATAIVGSGLTSIWAPDISYFNGTFHVYWAGSTFGSNTSVIGLATNTTLDPARAGYAWVDQGLVVQSRSTDNFNAIDPNVSFDATGAPWLAYGSFWSGIKLHKLNAATGLLATDDPTTYSIASRNGGAIEAASIISHNGFYYLFVSFDKCCSGVTSTYRTMAGRATAITGPYVDSTGKAMMQSGGDELIATSGRYIGPGGGTAWKDGDNYLYVYHYYDGQANGASKLLIRPITFSATDWIVLGDPIFP